MLVFIVQGITLVDLVDFAHHVDDVIEGNVNEPKPICIFGSLGMFQIECYDSEMGKRYEGAQALAMFIDEAKTKWPKQA